VIKKYFVYSPEEGFEEFDSIEERNEYAEATIQNYLDDDWDESVTNLVSGEIHTRATMIDKKERPPESEIDEEGCDQDGDIWAPEWNYRCNYTMKAIESGAATYYVHHVGPDDVHGPMTELEAMRLANELNAASAWHREDSPNRDFLPYSMALVKTAEQLNGGAE